MSLVVEEIRTGGADGRLRLSATVSTAPGASEEYWFELPARFGGSVATGPEPWLVLLLPMAAVTGSELVLPGRVDPTLLRNARELLTVWDCWFPWTERPEIRVRVAGPGGSPAAGRTGAFFSGGVDSFHTLLAHEGAWERDREEDGREIRDLVTVGGFDIPVEDGDACGRLFDMAREVAAELGRTSVAISTNVRETRWDDLVPWEPLGHGPALGACAHVLEGRLRRALIPAGSGYARMSPRGSHPLTDPLMSSGGVEVIHDGAGTRRADKTRLVAASELARRHLRVCWRSRSDHNCCRCEKCYRTMLTLELAGRLSEFESFDAGRFELSRLPRVFLSKESDFVFMREVRSLAEEAGREDAARRIDGALRRSRVKRRLLGLADRLDALPVLWRAAGWIRRRVRSRSIL